MASQKSIPSKKRPVATELPGPADSVAATASSPSSPKADIPPASVPGAAVAPKRARGERRVAAIIDAGAAVFAEKGYDGATMTEIAARADTAIGSLYRFFPTKAALADVLFKRYSVRLFEALAGLTDRATGAAPMASTALADALIDCMLALQSDRAAAIAMLDARDDTATLRAEFRTALLRKLGALLTTAAGASAAYAAVSAIVLLQLLKCVPVLAGGAMQGPDHDGNASAGESANAKPSSRRDAFALAGTMDELRALTRLYTARIYSEAKSQAVSAGAGSAVTDE